VFVRAGHRDDSPKSRHHRDYLDNRANAVTSRRFGWAGTASLACHSLAAERQRRWFRGLHPEITDLCLQSPGHHRELHK